MRVWFDGATSEGSIALNPADRGLTLGDGLFETILVIDGVALWLAEHLARFKASALELGITYPDVEIGQAVSDLSKGLIGAHVLRLTLTRGAGGRGLASQIETSTFFATIAPFDAGLMFQPVRTCVVAVTRNIRSPASRMKTLSYMDQILAAQEAADEGFEDAIMCNTERFVACGTVGNLFMLRDKTLVTPGLDQGILPGIMRGVVLKGAADVGFGIEERPVELHELSSADGLFLTNSLRLLRPHRDYSEKGFSPLVGYISSEIEKRCGRDPRRI